MCGSEFNVPGSIYSANCCLRCGNHFSIGLISYEPSVVESILHHVLISSIFNKLWCALNKWFQNFVVVINWNCASSRLAKTCVFLAVSKLDRLLHAWSYTGSGLRCWCSNNKYKSSRPSREAKTQLYLKSSVFFFFFFSTRVDWDWRTLELVDTRFFHSNVTSINDV